MLFTILGERDWRKAVIGQENPNGGVLTYMGQLGKISTEKDIFSFAPISHLPLP